MKLIGLSVLQDFGAHRPGAMQSLAALAAVIQAPDIHDMATLRTQLGKMIVKADGRTMLLEIAEAGCRVTLNVSDRLQTAQVVAVTALGGGNEGGSNEGE